MVTQETLREMLGGEVAEETLARVLEALSEPLSKAAQLDAQCRDAEERRREEVRLQTDRLLAMRGARSGAAARALLPMEELQMPGKTEKDIALAVDRLAASAEGAFLFGQGENVALVQVGMPLPEGEEEHMAGAAVWRAAGLRR